MKIIKDKDEKIKISKSILVTLTKLLNNFISILFIFSIFTFLLYLIGNYQVFLDKTQLIILKVLLITSQTSLIMSIVGIIIMLIKFLLFKFSVKKLINILYYFLPIITSTIFIIYSSLINQLYHGI